MNRCNLNLPSSSIKRQPSDWHLSFRKYASRLGTIFALALLVRLVPLGLYVTPDEPIWVFRAVGFMDAIAARDWQAIPPTSQPGTTTMVLGMLGIRITSWLYPAESAAHLAWIRKMAWLAPENGAAFPHLTAFLTAGRVLVALVTSAGIALTYHLARSRLGKRAARLLALFLALDPFFIGLSGVLHTDALQATFVMLAVLLSLPNNTKTQGGEDAKGERRWGSIVGVALCLALAGVTKTLGLLVTPGIALTMLWGDNTPWLQRVLRVMALAFLSLILVLGLNPANWGKSVPQTLLDYYNALQYHESLGLRSVFFAGQMTQDPGPLFYPTVLLFRLTPPVLWGLIVALRYYKKNTQQVLWFGLPALTYLGALTWATKKFDRYALSTVPLLAAIAATALANRNLWYKQFLLLTLLLLPYALVAPLPLFYATPLLGGPWVAQHVVPLGWGEAHGMTARRLARTLPNPETYTLLTSNVPGTASFFPGTTLAWETHREPCGEALVKAGYTAVPPKRTFAPLVQTQLASLKLGTGYVRSTRAESADANICPFIEAPAPNAMPRARFAGDLILQTLTWPEISQTDPRPQHLPVLAIWKPGAPQSKLDINLALEDAQHTTWTIDGGLLLDQRNWPSPAWEVNEFVTSETYLGLPPSLPPGTYTLTLSLYGESGQLGYWNPDSTFGGTRLPLGTLTLPPAAYPAETLKLPISLDIPIPGLKLIGARTPAEEHWAGDALSFALGWERTVGTPPQNLHWVLTCNNQTPDTGTLAIAPTDPAQWPGGHRYVTRYAPHTDPLLSKGICTFHIKVHNQIIPLGNIAVHQRARTFSLDTPPQIPLSITVGTHATLAGINLGTANIVPGDTFTVTLFWEAHAPFALDYTIFVHLLGPDGHVITQSDQRPQNGTAPTHTWLAGQIILDTHTLTVPNEAPAGSYTLAAGLYEATSGGRAPLYDAGGERIPEDRALLVFLQHQDDE